MEPSHEEKHAPATVRGMVGAELVIQPSSAGTLRDIIGRHGAWRTALTIFGVAILVAWAFWWASSLSRGRLRAAEKMWFPVYHFLGVDFQHNYYAANHWLRGGNPYDGHFGAPLEAKYCYPPVVLPLFAWCRFFTTPAAVIIWTVALAVVAGLGAYAAWRVRTRLGLWHVPLPFALAATLCATPVVFAMERGNYDLLVLVFLLAGAWFLRTRSWYHDVLAGCCLALAVWIKIYPVLLMPGLFVLSRYRVLVCCVVAGTVVGLADVPHTREFVQNVKRLAKDEAPAKHGILAECTHSVSGSWDLFWTNTRFAWMKRVPGSVVWASVALPLVVFVSWCVRRSPASNALACTYLVWLTAVGTFLPAVSNDYNLAVLPLAALAVWDRRDPVWVHLLMAFMVLWWQPIRLPIGADLLFVFKVLGTVAVGACLANRARELVEVGARTDARNSGLVGVVRAAA